MPAQTTDQWGSYLPKGLGNDQEATQATAAFRQSPWYQDWAKQNNLQFEGDQYGNAKLNDDQKSDLYNQLVQHGVGLNNKYDEIDDNGQISEGHHKLKKFAIGAAIGGLGLTGLGAAGIGPLAGLFGGAAAAGGAGAGLAGADAAGAAALGGGGLAAGLPGAMATLPALGSLGTAAGVGGAGAAMTGLATGLPGEMASLPALGSGGLIEGLPGAMTSLPAVGAAGKGSLITSLMSGLKNPKNLADLSRIMQQGATDAQGNRVIQGNFANQYDQNSLKAQQDRNATESDALQKLNQTKYLLEGGFKPAAQSIMMNGASRAVQPLLQQPTASSAAQKAGAQTLQDQLVKRLAPGGTYSPIPFDQYGTPGLGEKLMNYGGQAAGVGGTLMKLLGH